MSPPSRGRAARARQHGSVNGKTAAMLSKSAVVYLAPLLLIGAGCLHAVLQEQLMRELEDLPLPSANKDELSAVMADKSGKFLKTYAIDHGHNSLREGSVVHLAIERVSQLVTRFIQRERRCSFEEDRPSCTLRFSGALYASAWPVRG